MASIKLGFVHFIHLEWYCRAPGELQRGEQAKSWCGADDSICVTALFCL